MSTTSPRRYVLGGVLLLALGGLAVDRLTGLGGGPRQAQAAPTPARPVTAAWQDVEDLVARLTETEYVSVSAALSELDRDLFLPTEALEAVLGPPVDSAESPEEPSDELAAPPFESRHRLSGVMLGRHPLAVVDDRLMRLDSRVEGYVLVEIHRDHVVFRSDEGDKLVSLVLQQCPKAP